MSNALLSWDDFDEPETAIEKAKKAIKNIDTTETEKELQEQAEVFQQRRELKDSGLTKLHNTPITNPRISPNDLNSANQKLLSDAAKIVEIMDSEMVPMGKVDVSTKFLINSKADLNQLIPFKYNWAWSLYLTSCEQHWMPAEYNLEKDKLEFTTPHLSKTTHKVLLARAFYTYQVRAKYFTEVSLLNIYRLITNPECRQYILRQSFESALVHHAWMHITESFVDSDTLGSHQTTPTGKTLLEYLSGDDSTFRSRNKELQQNTLFINTLTAQTTSLDEQRSFVLNLLTVYGYINWTMIIGPYYQLIKAAAVNDRLNQVTEIIIQLLRDAVTQTLFAKELILNILQENPEILSEQFVAEINKQFRMYLSFEQQLAQTLTTTDTEFSEVSYLVDHYMMEFLNDCGIGCTYEFNRNSTPNPTVDAFKQRVNNLQPKVDHETNSTGGHLAWENI